jgi:DNA-binding MarR family transcriptional regulator
MEFNVQVRNSQFEKSLLNKIARLANSLEREVEKELKVSFALTFSQFRVLNALATLGEASQSTLAAGLEVTPAVVTRQAEVLAARGLLMAEQNPRSKREKVIKLTPKGGQAAAEAAQTVSDKQKLILASLSLKDETAFRRGVEVLSKVLQERV